MGRQSHHRVGITLARRDGSNQAMEVTRDSIQSADRNYDTDNAVPSVIWLVLLVGGAITVSYALFFGMKNIKAQYMITAALTVTITLILFLIYVLDHPFTGTSKVSVEPLKQVMEIVQKE